MKYILISIVMLTLTACENFDPKADSPTSGKLKMGVDESYTLLMQAEIDAFENTYEHADLHATYLPESDVMAALMMDSIQVAVVSRRLTEQEESVFKSRQRTANTLLIAVDGVALIVNQANSDTTFTLDRIGAILQGRDSIWSQVNAASTLGKINVVFDNTKSCNARFMREKFLQNGAFPANCFAVQNNQEVIDYVASNKGALGVISTNWISDPTDSTSRSFLDKVRVVGIQNPESARPDLYRKPYQAYIFDGSYALTREVYVIETSLSKTVGTGFVSHMATEKGQLIVKRSGMAPATVTPRQIRIVTE